MSTKYIIKSFHLYFKKKKILGCYNSTPLKMNLVPEIRRDGDKGDIDSPPLDSSLLHRVVPSS